MNLAQCKTNKISDKGKRNPCMYNDLQLSWENTEARFYLILIKARISSQHEVQGVLKCKIVAEKAGCSRLLVSHEQLEVTMPNPASKITARA